MNADDRRGTKTASEEEERYPSSKKAGTGVYITALILGAMAIGFAPIFVRWSESGPAATAFWRLALSLLPMTLLLLGSKQKPSGRETRSAWLPAIFAGLFFGMDLVFWHWSIQLTTVANATFETNLSAAFIPLLAWVFYGQRVSRVFVIALLVSLAGTAFLVGANANITPSVLQGDAYGVISALFYSVYLLALKAGRDRGASVPFLMIVSGFVSALFLLLAAAIMGEQILPATWVGWLVVIALALVSQVAGQSLITFSLGGVPASFAGIGLLIQPATAAAAAWLLLGEHLTLPQIAGGIVLLAGLLMARGQLKT